MNLHLCPRCELNYITANEKLCKICLREMKGGAPKDEVELCSICNEEPALPGRDVCLFCLREMSGNSRRTDVTEDENDRKENGSTVATMDSVSTMDEIIPEIDDDIPSQEYHEMENELSLETVNEEEQRMEEQALREESEE